MYAWYVSVIGHNINIHDVCLWRGYTIGIHDVCLWGDHIIRFHKYLTITDTITDELPIFIVLIIANQVGDAGPVSRHINRALFSQNVIAISLCWT